jgi:hypothetical protein
MAKAGLGAGSSRVPLELHLVTGELEMARAMKPLAPHQTKIGEVQIKLPEPSCLVS